MSGPLARAGCSNAGTPRPARSPSCAGRGLPGVGAGGQTTPYTSAGAPLRRVVRTLRAPSVSLELPGEPSFEPAGPADRSVLGGPDLQQQVVGLRIAVDACPGLGRDRDLRPDERVAGRRVHPRAA